MPALNEAESIEKVIKSLPKQILNITDIQILVVDDGSSDETAAISKSTGAIVVSHKSNQGVGGAFKSAVKKALELDVDIMVSIDADGQFNSDQIKDLVKPIIDEKADFVTGNRFHVTEKPEHMSGVKYWGNMKMNKLISFISGSSIYDASCGFRAYNREALLNLNLMGKFTYTHETILDLIFKGLTLEHIPIDVEYFADRKSRVASSITRYAVQSFKIIFRFFRDYKPFYFFGSISLVTFIISCICNLFVLIRLFFGSGMTPYKFVGVIGGSLLMISILFFILTLIADMLGRIRVNQERIIYSLKKQKEL